MGRMQILSCLLACPQVLHSCHGYRLTLWGKLLYIMCVILTGGIILVLTLANAELTLWRFTPSPLQEADFILTTVVT